MIQKFKNHFVSGLLVIGPVFLTVIVIRYLVRLTDRLIVNPVFQILPIEVDATSKIILTKLLIALLVVLLVSFVGFATKKFIFKQLFLGWDAILHNIPFFNRLYMSIKEIALAFFGDKSGVFKRVVFLEYPRKGIYVLGFIMTEKRWDIHEKTGKDIVNVFVPSPPNPATGQFVFVPKEELIEAGITVEEGIRLVISGGAAVPPLKKNGGH